MMMTIIMMIMIKIMIIAVTKSIFKLGPPDIAWKYIHIITRIRF